MKDDRNKKTEKLLGISKYLEYIKNLSPLHILLYCYTSKTPLNITLL